MSDTALKESLDRLHRALGASTSISAQDREQLERLAEDIRRLLATSGAPAVAADRSLLDRLKATVTRFEVTHPDLTATLAQVSKTLSDMGI